MILTGYHGTSKESAAKILDSNEFILSVGDTEWLGQGIYFYFDYSDAVEWTKIREIEQPAIVLGIIRAADRDVLDFDSEKGGEIFGKFERLFLKHNVSMVSESAQQNQCALMQYIWKNVRHYKVFIGSFPKHKKHIPLIMDIREKRREFCVRNNRVIANITELGVVE